jgi:integrase
VAAVDSRSHGIRLRSHLFRTAHSGTPGRRVVRAGRGGGALVLSESRSPAPRARARAGVRCQENCQEKAGLVFVPKLVFHDLRHVYASMTIERGITSMELADLMGHSNSGVTKRRYVHLFNRQRTEDKLRAALQNAWRVGKPLASTAGNGRERDATGEERKTASLHVFGSDGD